MLPALFRDLSAFMIALFFSPPDLAEASWSNGGGGRSRARRHGIYSQLSFSLCCVLGLFWSIPLPAAASSDLV